MVALAHVLASTIMTTPPIPTTITDATAEWMTEVLRGSTAIPADTSVSSLSTHQIGQGVGLMGELYVATLEYVGGEGPASVVVKLPSMVEANRQQGVALGMFEAECRFYSEMGDLTGAGLPEVHLSIIESGTADFVIVMEDLSHMEMVDQSTGMTLEQAQAAVRVLADVHAAWWGKVQTPELEWIPSLDGARIEMVNGLLPQLWPIFLGAFADRLPEGGAELGENWSNRYLELMGGLAARSPWTLLHQDFRVENMLFGDASKNEVTVIDWQGLGRGPGCYDVAYILGGSMPIELRRENERDLVAAYHERLLANGVSDFSLEQAWDDYVYGHLLGGLATSVFAGGTLDLANERGFELIADMANRHFTAALDYGGFAILDK
jgi:aminoglycoside/choline kinase family phosphotransferase